MKMTLVLGTGLVLLAGVVMAAGVSGITEDGSVDGNTAYQITCYDGDSFGHLEFER